MNQMKKMHERDIKKLDEIFDRAKEWLDLSRNNANSPLYLFAQAVQEDVTNARCVLTVHVPAMLCSIQDLTLNASTAMMVAKEMNYIRYLITDFDRELHTAAMSAARERVKRIVEDIVSSPHAPSPYVKARHDAMARYYRTYRFLVEQ